MTSRMPARSLLPLLAAAFGMPSVREPEPLPERRRELLGPPLAGPPTRSEDIAERLIAREHIPPAIRDHVYVLGRRQDFGALAATPAPFERSWSDFTDPTTRAEEGLRQLGRLRPGAIAPIAKALVKQAEKRARKGVPLLEALDSLVRARAAQR